MKTIISIICVVLSLIVAVFFSCDKENYDLIRSLFRENMDCGSILLMSKGGNVYDPSGKRFNCKESPFLPEPYPYTKDIKLDLDVFARPFCRVCGSRRIYIKAGSYANH